MDKNFIMSILLTGSEGFIGKRLQKKLKGRVERIDFKLGLDLISCPLPDEIDIIYHLAAQTSVESSWYDPIFDLNNIRITARLVKEYPNAKIIYANSCASVNPKSPYGFSKKVSGDYLKIFHNNWVDLIFPNIYGGSEQSVVDLFKGKDEVIIYGDGTHIRDYVHVDDIVDGLIKSTEWESGTYFMGSEKGTSVLELAQGKKINFAPERKEEIEVVVKNTTPHWSP